MFLLPGAFPTSQSRSDTSHQLICFATCVASKSCHRNKEASSQKWGWRYIWSCWSHLGFSFLPPNEPCSSIFWIPTTEAPLERRISSINVFVDKNSFPSLQSRAWNSERHPNFSSEKLACAPKWRSQAISQITTTTGWRETRYWYLIGHTSYGSKDVAIPRFDPFIVMYVYKFTGWSLHCTHTFSLQMFL